jgi:hypothetical protein
MQVIDDKASLDPLFRAVMESQSAGIVKEFMPQVNSLISPLLTSVFRDTNHHGIESFDASTIRIGRPTIAISAPAFATP